MQKYSGTKRWILNLSSCCLNWKYPLQYKNYSTSMTSAGQNITEQQLLSISTLPYITPQGFSFIFYLLDMVSAVPNLSSYDHVATFSQLCCRTLFNKSSLTWLAIANNSWYRPWLFLASTAAVAFQQLSPHTHWNTLRWSRKPSGLQSAYKNMWCSPIGFNWHPIVWNQIL